MYLEEVLPEFRKGAKIRSVLWRRGQYLRYDAKTKDIIDEEGVTYDITGNLLSSNLWEFYKEPIDWEYIIANSCPCWFWNNVKNLRVKGTLIEVDDTCDYSFRSSLHGTYYKNCCPCRKDEINFYEDKK